MKIEDIPKEIAESHSVGELFLWNHITILIDELESVDENVIEIKRLIDLRRENLLESEC